MKSLSIATGLALLAGTGGAASAGTFGFSFDVGCRHDCRHCRDHHAEADCGSPVAQNWGPTAAPVAPVVYTTIPVMSFAVQPVLIGAPVAPAPAALPPGIHAPVTSGPPVPPTAGFAPVSAPAADCAHQDVIECRTRLNDLESKISRVADSLLTLSSKVDRQNEYLRALAPDPAGGQGAGGGVPAIAPIGKPPAAPPAEGAATSTDPA